MNLTQSDELLSWQFPVHYGKLCWLKERAAASPQHTGHPRMIYVFRRLEIETQDYTGFVSWLKLHVEEARLDELRGRMQFAFEGWDSDDRGVFEIPELRRYFGALTKAGAAWFFVADLNEPDNLKMIAACSVEKIDIVRKRDWETLTVSFPESTIRDFADTALHAHAMLSDLADITPSEAIMQLGDTLDALFQVV